jgi:membrane-associated phospholipid phosphatase
MHFITDFADQAVILPLVLAIGITLLAQGWRRGAAAWAVAVFATFSTMLVLKLVFIACPASLGVSDVHTPSGHVAAATVVAGGLAALLLRRRHAALGVAALAAVIIAVTRLALREHTPAEVVIGASVGLLGAWTLLALAGRPPPEVGVGRISAVAVAVVVVFHGLHLPAEAHIRSTALRVAHMLSVCQPDEARL